MATNKMKKLLFLIIPAMMFSSCKKDDEIIIQNTCNQQDTIPEIKYFHYKTKLIYGDQDSNMVINFNENSFQRTYFIFQNNIPKKVIVDFENYMPFHDFEQNYNDSIYYPPLSCQTKIWILNNNKEIRIEAINPGSHYLFYKKKIVYLRRI